MDFVPALSSLLFALLAWSAPQAGAWPPAPALELPRAARGPGELPPSIRARPAGTGRWSCRFTFKPPRESVRSVCLAGSFNAWKVGALPLRKGPGRVWSGELELAEGRWLYKFVVDGQRWYPDPRNSRGEDDGHGGRNSVLVLGRAAPTRPSRARVGDGRVDGGSLLHDPGSLRYVQLLPDGRVLLRLATAAHDLEGVAVSWRGGGSHPLRVVLENPRIELWEGILALPPSVPTAIEYCFVLEDGDTRVSTPRTWTLNRKTMHSFQTPEWSKNATWYQVFVDRFRNGNAENDPNPVRPWTSAWFTPSPWERKSGKEFYEDYVYHRFYGGDLQGLEGQLGYLKDLGVTALYLNPIFQARSPHKYDTTDYRHVDEHFGKVGDYAQVASEEDLLDPATWKWTDSDEIFLEFLRKAHAQGFKVVIDGVFNHVGTAHPAFQDLLAKGRHSRFADWFEVTSWKPFRYQGWAGFGELPVFKKGDGGFASAEVRDHLFAITRRWMDPDGDGDPSDGIDGWRLDVPNEIPGPFWEDWRRLVKSINPEAYISGEIWDRADSWLEGNRFDAVMNYPFAAAAVDWLGGGRKGRATSAFVTELADLRMAYPRAATDSLMNLLDSHDTDRLVSMFANPGRDYDRMNRPQDDNPDYDQGKPSPECYARARLLALLQATYVGAPMIYYGDEVGMWGADDPSCRKPMLWKDLEPYQDAKHDFVMEDQLQWYRRVFGLRRAHPALRTGSLHTLLVDDEQRLWVFERAGGGEKLLVALNGGEEAVSRESGKVLACRKLKILQKRPKT